MESISSINIQKITNNPLLHNQRVFSPCYAITSANHETINYIDENLQSLKKRIIDDYESTPRGKYGKFQKWQTKSTPLMEAVVNIKSTTTMKELEELKNKLESQFNCEILQVSKHMDEGKFIITDEITQHEYFVERGDNHKFMSIEDNQVVEHTMIEPDGTKIEIKGKIRRDFNYHAHLIINKYNFSEHKNTRWKPHEMEAMQTMVAKQLNMVRGIKGSTTKR